MDRRHFMGTVAVGASLAATSRVFSQENNEPFSLPELPYAYDALEPHIDAQTMEIHHSKHHAAYVNGLNAAVAGTQLAQHSALELVANWRRLPEELQTRVRNSGGGHVNHTLFWEIMSPEPAEAPGDRLARAIDQQFESLDGFWDAFSSAAGSVFGSGWAWLSVNEQGRLQVETSPNQDSPWMEGRTPILGIDVWEHAYYLKYQNRRPDYVAAFRNVIDWDKVTERYEALR